MRSILCPSFVCQAFPSLRLEVTTCLLTAWCSCWRTYRLFLLWMTVPQVNLPCPGGNIASWSRTACLYWQALLLSQLTSISEAHTDIFYLRFCLVGDGHPTTEMEAACPTWQCFQQCILSFCVSDEVGLCIIHVSCPLEEALQRNRSRSEGRVEDHVIAAMHERLETPDSDKRPWEKYSSTVDGIVTVDLWVTSICIV